MMNEDFEESEPERNGASEKISKEVMILKSLDHPNII
jgi:hypothetical protein